MNWTGYGFWAVAPATAIEVAVANQLRQRSSFRDVVIAGVVGCISIVTIALTIAVASPLLEPLLNIFGPRFFPFYSAPHPGAVALAALAWIFAVTINTGMGILRRARKAMIEEKSDQADTNVR